MAYRWQTYQKQHPRGALLGILALIAFVVYLLSGPSEGSVSSASGQDASHAYDAEQITRYQYPPPNFEKLQEQQQPQRKQQPPPPPKQVESESTSSNDGNEHDSDATYPAFGPRSLKKAVARAEELWEENIARREAFVAAKGGYSNIMAFSDKAWQGWGNMWTLWDIFVPAFPCPWETARLGVMADGGKYVCGLPRIQQARGKKCVVYSFGVEQESSFESEILEKTECEIFMYDFSVETYGPQIRAMNDSMQRRAHFHPYGLSDRDEVLDGNQFYTLKTIMQQNGHDWIDILKVDIEGAEFHVLPQVARDFGDGHLPFGQLLLEIHAEKTKTPYSTAEFAEWWETLEKAGLRAFTSELNYPSIHWLHNPSAMEMNFVNNCNGKADCGTLLRD